jgi:hypothetical protein
MYDLLSEYRLAAVGSAIQAPVRYFTDLFFLLLQSPTVQFLKHERTVLYVGWPFLKKKRKKKTTKGP